MTVQLEYFANRCVFIRVIKQITWCSTNGSSSLHDKYLGFHSVHNLAICVFSTDQFANQAQESITWFPEYREVSNTTMTEEYDDTINHKPYNETLVNDDTCTHAQTM